MGRQKFTPVPGRTYRNRAGGEFFCLRGLDEPYNAEMQNVASGWTFKAYGCAMYPNGTIDWDYSTGGYFAEEGK